MGNKIISNPLLMEWGVASRALTGEAECGDLHLVKPVPAGLLIAVTDGLGHGHEAAAASQIAIATLEEHAYQPIVTLVRRCHEALKGTRGVVMSIALLEAPASNMTWLGVGNVEGVLVRSDRSEGLPKDYILLLGGVLGYQLPALRPATLSLLEGDTLIFATDGIRHGFVNALPQGEPPQQVAEHILAHYGKTTDDALVLVARYHGVRP